MDRKVNKVKRGYITCQVVFIVLAKITIFGGAAAAGGGGVFKCVWGGELLWGGGVNI